MKVVYWQKANKKLTFQNPTMHQNHFYLFYSNVWGPSKVTTISGKKWFVTFIDDHTRLCWVFNEGKI